MPEDPRPPVAVRISRPQATEDDFLEQELDTLNRTSVTLLGAQPRPQGVVLRFELVLASGLVVLRGEGRVVGFKPNALNGLGGLTLRFTRLDSRSKALIDRATALRERRRPSSMPAPPHAEPSPTPGPVATDAPASVRPPPVAPPPESLSATDVTSEPPPAPAARSVPPPPRPRSMPPPLPAAARSGYSAHPPPVRPAIPEALPTEPTARVATAPVDRNALLDRLRMRARSLDDAAVKRILEQRRRA